MKIVKLNKFHIGKIRHHTLWVFEYPLWSFYYLNRFGWFRLFGVGLKWKDITRHGLLFSQRYGYEKAITIGKWRISILKHARIKQS
jgi:hypothetical protein